VLPSKKYRVKVYVGTDSISKRRLESFFADLRRCREHCGGRRFVEHRTSRPHECDEHEGVPRKRWSPSTCRACVRMCRRHKCRGLSDSSIRQIHWILSALNRAVRWRWIAVNPATQAEPPALPHPDPRPPSAEEAARLVEEAFTRDPDWGAFIWLAMTVGARRGPMCALRWSDVDLAGSVLALRRALYVEGGEVLEKDTKTHPQRRIVLDSETVAVLREHLDRCKERAAALELDWSDDSFVFSLDADNSTPLLPDSVSQRYERMAKRLGIDTTLHKLRHYWATELISAGVDVHTVAGRLGKGGGGATTLRVYAAWVSEADQCAAAALSAGMPRRPGSR
jgi:integrase